MKFAAETRKQLGFRTVFNILGPMSNPFSPGYQILGVYSQELLPKVMHVSPIGNKSYIVCNSLDGFDEFSILRIPGICFIKMVKVTEHLFSPNSLRLEKTLATMKSLSNQGRSSSLSTKFFREKY